MNFQKFISWHKSFTKEGFTEEKIECFCKDTNGFYITRRQASAASSIIIILATILFIIGYLMGQRKAIQEFTSKVVNDSFADQVNYSMYSLYGDNANNEQEAEQTQESYSEDEAKIQSDKIVKSENAIKNDVQTQSNNSTSENQIRPEESKVNNAVQANVISDVKHYAILIGFGSRKFAEQFVNKVEKMGYNVFIIPRKSKTAKGKVVNWYQVITDKFDDKSKLINMANKIKASQRLNDIKYMTAD